MDSLIRLRQLNTGDLFSFAEQSFPLLRKSGIVTLGHITPGTSGAFDLGNPTGYYRELYVNEISLPTGSGIWFGTTFVSAYTSGTDAYLRVGAYTISSTANGISIIGPTGPSGVTGASGASGIGVTGAVLQSGQYLRLLFSNGGSGNAINMPSGLQGPSGATGISITGFQQFSGTGLRFLFSNGTTGLPFSLPSGLRGRDGIAGGMSIRFDQFTGFNSGQVYPRVTIYDVDPLGVTENPTLNLIRGMTYTFDYSGLNLSGITLTGNGIDYPTGSGLRSNFFIESGITGYLKFVAFKEDTTGYAYNFWTGRLIRQEIVRSGGVNTTEYNNVTNKLQTTDIFYNAQEAVNRTSLTVTVKLGSSASRYRYGFQKYNFFTQQPIDDGGAWGFYHLGLMDVAYVGATGPTGASGLQGAPGPVGDTGPQGPSGIRGVSVIGTERDGNLFRFLFSDDSVGEWIDMPEGGPTGPYVTSAVSVGGTGVYFVLSNSSQTNTVPLPSGATGPQGIAGASGIGERYATSFLYSDTSISGSGSAFRKQVSGSSNWVLCTGNNRIFTYGDKVEFYNDALRGLAYTPWLKLLFADTPASRMQYFYATVQEYNSSIGLLQFLVEPTPAAIGLAGSDVDWYNYATVSVNLGGLGSSGARGDTGIQGIQGLKGDTGNAVFSINNPISGLKSGQSHSLRMNTYDAWNLYITGANNTINFDYTTISTGQTFIMRIRNSGNPSLASLDNTNPIPLINWDTGIYFPYETNAPAPNSGYTHIYSFLRYPDNGGQKVVFCTYSVNYNV